MPRFVCDDCNAVFDSRDGFNEHSCTPRKEENTSNFSLPVDDINWDDPMTLAVIITTLLFAGSTAAFAMFSSPGTSSQSQDQTRGDTEYSLASDTTPPTGQGLQTFEDLPRINQADLPEQHVLDTPIPRAVQVHLLVGGQNRESAALLQYNPETLPRQEQEALARLGQDWNPRVYVAPHHGIDTPAVYTVFRQRRTADTVNKTMIEQFICNGLRNPPANCLYN